MKAHYQGALPVELMKEEQDRITAELEETGRAIWAAEVQLEQMETLIRRSMQFLSRCYETYVSSPPAIRRQLNQAMFEAFFVTHDGSLVAKPTEFFRTLLRTDALRVKNGRGSRGPEPSDLHDSTEWQDGVPAWLADAFKDNKKKGSSSSRRSTPDFSDLGLKEDYLAGWVGFENQALALHTEAEGRSLFRGWFRLLVPAIAGQPVTGLQVALARPTTPRAARPSSCRSSNGPS